ncbi:hypothetical protein SAMN02745126_04990 [Enhydrobacter aerosaccus]|uniref:Uncharacterized protein n=1 Tax=Enhydrobacter aerosaccus TaxID=225324 RepID=A0A1T4SRR8_9HYPH|nr:hypothetical protein [Enhydrobacter aerosaccus]SKA30581.1 hypothetical protein SAMN02745126_04990 [Enhydrobacter aerosaccus]
MKRELANRIAGAMKQVERSLGALDEAIRDVENEAERKQMLRTVIEAVHNLHQHISVPVARRYPDLHPDGHGRTY